MHAWNFHRARKIVVLVRGEWDKLLPCLAGRREESWVEGQEDTLETQQMMAVRTEGVRTGMKSRSVFNPLCFKIYRDKSDKNITSLG